MAGSSNPSLSIVIPAYNEEHRLPETIRNLRTFFGRESGVMPGLEIIIVIEKSSDRTARVATAAIENNPMFRLIENSVHRGKGYAVRTGMLEAQGDIIFFMDADLSTPLAEIFKFVGELSARPEIDILIGSRAEAQSQILKKQTWIRRNMGRGFNKFVKAFGVSGVRDTQCGFKAFRRRAVEPIFSRAKIDGFAFDVEILVLAETMGYNFATVPVRWVNSTDSRVRIWIDPFLMLIDLVRIKRIVRQSLKERPHDPKS